MEWLVHVYIGHWSEYSRKTIALISGEMRPAINYHMINQQRLFSIKNCGAENVHFGLILCRFDPVQKAYPLNIYSFSCQICTSVRRVKNTRRNGQKSADRHTIPY